VTNISQLTEEACVSGEIFKPEKNDNAHTALVPEGKFGKVHALYLAAAGLGTIGWVWFIAWCALQLI
jgi:hypothetical protein